MTKTNRRPARSLSAAELAATAGGYTLTLSYDLSSYFGTNATLANASKPLTDTSTSTTDNIK